MSDRLQEVADRLDIRDTIAGYSYCIDQRIWNEWDKVFLPEAVIDYSFWGMTPCTPQELKESMAVSHSNRISGQHLLHHQMIWLEGDNARAHTEFTLYAVLTSEAPGKSVMRASGGWYEDRLVRTHEGWRIAERRGFGKWLVREEVDAQEQHAHRPWLMTSSPAAQS